MRRLMLPGRSNSFSRSASTVFLAEINRRRSSGRTYPSQSFRNSRSTMSAGLLNRRASARLSPPVSQTLGTFRSNSASIGSISVSSIEFSFNRRISISLCFLQRCQQEIAMELLDVKLRPFPRTGPNYRSTLMVDFQHMLLRLLLRVPKDPLKNHRDVAHQIHWVVVHHNAPRSSE